MAASTRPFLTVQVEKCPGCRVSARHGPGAPVERMDVIASTECAGSCRAEGGASPGVAPTAVRLAFCSRCWTRFAVCRACDRCQVYCGRRCSEQARLEDLREIRRRYRRTERGRAAHREQERRR